MDLESRLENENTFLGKIDLIEKSLGNDELNDHISELLYIVSGRSFVEEDDRRYRAYTWNDTQRKAGLNKGRFSLIEDKIDQIHNYINNNGIVDYSHVQAVESLTKTLDSYDYLKRNYNEAQQKTLEKLTDLTGSMKPAPVDLAELEPVNLSDLETAKPEPDYPIRQPVRQPVEAVSRPRRSSRVFSRIGEGYRSARDRLVDGYKKARDYLKDGITVPQLSASPSKMMGLFALTVTIPFITSCATSPAVRNMTYVDLSPQSIVSAAEPTNEEKLPAKPAQPITEEAIKDNGSVYLTVSEPEDHSKVLGWIDSYRQSGNPEDLNKDKWSRAADRWFSLAPMDIECVKEGDPAYDADTHKVRVRHDTVRGNLDPKMSFRLAYFNGSDNEYHPGLQKGVSAIEVTAKDYERASSGERIPMMVQLTYDTDEKLDEHPGKDINLILSSIWPKRMPEKTYDGVYGGAYK